MLLRKVIIHVYIVADRTVLQIVKSRGRRRGDEYVKLAIPHSDYWIHGTVAAELAGEVATLLKDMVQGKLGKLIIPIL